MNNLWIFCILIILYLQRSVKAGTGRPIIGILAQEQAAPLNKSYIPASYVKAAEAAGARVAPIFINKEPDYYKKIVSVLNGVILPGGDLTDLTAATGFSRAAKIIFELATKHNDEGVHYPILGVCQGMEILAILSNNDTDLLRTCPGLENRALPIKFKPGYRRSSLYAKISHKDFTILSKLNSTANHHHWCLTEKNLTERGLNRYWQVLTVNKDDDNQEFISSMEAYNYPFVGVQFHPEMVPFEWKIPMKNPHSIQAINANRLFYDWLINESRQNDHHFNFTSEEERSLIYNYQQVYTGKDGGDYEQIYVF